MDQDFELVPIVEMKSADCHVILVHGTWARRSAWVFEGSSIVKKLQHEFPGSSIHRFMWSGHNRFEARQRAAESLQARILSLGPDAVVYLVSHSHGGNVAWIAARNLPTVRAIVAMGVPFLHIRELPKHHIPTQLLFCWSSFYLLAIALHFYSAWLPTSLLFFFVLGSLAMPLLLLARLTKSRMARYLPAAAASSSASQTSAACPSLLALRLPSDEASLVLSLAESIYRVARQAFFLVFGLHRVVENSRPAALAFIDGTATIASFVGFVYGAIWCYRIFELNGEDYAALLAFLALSLMFGFVMYKSVQLVMTLTYRLATGSINAIPYLAAFVMPHAYVICGVHLTLAFGWELGPHCHRIRVSAESAPGEASAVLEVVSDGKWVGRGSSVAHFLQEHPDVVQRSVRFLASKQRDMIGRCRS